MEIDNPAAKSYLTELCSRTQGDIGAQVSMYDVGEAIGLPKVEAGIMAEELMVQGFVELKTLSGGIGITSLGVEMIQGKVSGSRITASESLQLGKGTVLGDMGRRAVEKVLGNVRAAAVQPQTTFGQMEEIVIDIKTIETQMLSPHPKIAVIREVLRSLHSTLTGLGGNALVTEIDALIHS